MSGNIVKNENWGTPTSFPDRLGRLATYNSQRLGDANTLGATPSYAYQQLSVSGTAVGLTVPNDPQTVDVQSGAVITTNQVVAAMIQVEGNDVRWRDDGTNPTATTGMRLIVGSTPMWYTSPAGLSTIKFIAVTGTATLNIVYYT